MRQVYPPVRPGGSATGVSSPGNTAEPSRELSVGDLVVVGAVPLVCERAGWAPLRGGITQARPHEYGTRPLPQSGGPDAPGSEQEDPPHLSRDDQNAPPALPGEPATARDGVQVVNKISGM